jgi:hypothetical protein
MATLTSSLGESTVKVNQTANSDVIVTPMGNGSDAVLGLTLQFPNCGQQQIRFVSDSLVGDRQLAARVASVSLKTVAC